MSQEGIFRLSGNARLIDRLKSSFNTSGDAPLEVEGDVASAAALLKLFLRELAEPVVPVSAQDDFLHAARSYSQNTERCVEELKELVHQLPEEHFLLLQYLVRFLLRVSLLEEQNRMSASSLGIVFGPNLFRVSDDFSGLKDQAVTNQIVTTLIKNYAVIFEENSNYGTQQILKQPFRCVTEPLSVFIPPVDDSVLTLRGRQGQEIDLPTKQIPVLMVDSFVDIANHTAHFDHIHDGQSNHRVSTPPCRKRKERKFSGEEQQVFRSSSEERPVIGKQQGETYLTVASQIRRCNSHEEMRNQSDPTSSVGRRKSSAEMVGVNLLMSSGGQVILSTEEKELSPHPPKPKRRELEASPVVPLEPAPPSLEETYHYRSLPPDQYDFHEMQRSAERTAPRASASRSRRLPSRSTLRKSYSEGMEDDSATLYYQNTNDRRSWTPTSSRQDSVDSLCYADVSSQGNSHRPLMSRHSSLDGEDTLYHHAVLDHMGVETFHKVHRSAEDGDSLNGRDSIPHLDLNTLHEHGDGDEPILSEQRYSWSMAKPSQEDVAMLSPSAHHLKKSTGLHLDPNLPPSPPVEQADLMKSTMKEDEAVAMTAKQLNKKMHALKKRVKSFEELFEKEHGFRPSIAEKMNYPEIKKILLEMNKTRKELRELKEDGQANELLSPSQEFLIKRSDAPSVEDSLQDALRNLSAKRRLSQRPEIVEDMTDDQVQDEKLAIQKVLLRFESIHGRPTTKYDRDMMRPLYDRYRNVKRIITRSSSLGALGKGKDPASELQPILEHETMDFTSPQHQAQRIPLASDHQHFKDAQLQEEDEEECDVACQEIVQNEVAADTPGERLQRDREMAATQSLLKGDAAPTDLDYKSSNLHELPLSDLMDQQQRSRLEKRRVRRILREFEEAFQRQTGRRVQKEDRTPMETVYSDYKHIKARLKLLEALISKHEQM